MGHGTPGSSHTCNAFWVACQGRYICFHRDTWKTFSCRRANGSHAAHWCRSPKAWSGCRRTAQTDRTHLWWRALKEHLVSYWDSNLSLSSWPRGLLVDWPPYLLATASPEILWAPHTDTTLSHVCLSFWSGMKCAVIFCDIRTIEKAEEEQQWKPLNRLAGLSHIHCSPWLQGTEVQGPFRKLFSTSFTFPYKASEKDKFITTPTFLK